MFDKFGFKKIINPNKKFLENILFGLIFIILISASAIIGGGDFCQPKNRISDVYATTAIFPKDWKTEVASTNYMSTVLTPKNLTKIQFEKEVPNNYEHIGTLSTGILVYLKSNSTEEIAFVWSETIYAPEDCEDLFYDLNLKDITFNNFDTSNVTNMKYFFYACPNLTRLDLSGFSTENVLYANQMFVNCSSMSVLDISSFNLESLTHDYYVNTSSELKWIKLPSTFNSENSLYITSTLNLYYKSDSTTTAAVTAGSTTEIDSSYAGKTLSAKYSISFDTNYATSSGSFGSKTIDYLYDTQSQKISFFETLPTKTGYYFTNWSVLLSSWVACKYFIVIPANGYGSITLQAQWTSSDVTFPTTWKTEIASEFYMCDNVLSLDTITKIQFEASSPSNYTYIGTLSTGIDVYKNLSVETEIAFVFPVVSAPSDCSNLFSNNNDLTELKTLSFANFNTQNVTNMSSMFKDCFSLTSLDLSGFNMINVTNFLNMLNFGETSKITLLKTPYNNSSTLIITTHTNKSRLYNIETSETVTSVPTTSTSLTYKRGVVVKVNFNSGNFIETEGWTIIGETATKVVYFGESIGTLPFASLSDYVLSGYSTTENGESEILETSTFIEDSIIFAKWTALEDGKITITVNFADDLVNTISYGVIKIIFKTATYTIALKEKTYTLNELLHGEYQISVIVTKKVNEIETQIITISDDNTIQTITLDVEKDQEGNKYVVTSN